MVKIVDTEMKYRPRNLEEYVFPNNEVREMALAYGSGEITRPLILSGTNGSGKTLLAGLIPHQIEGGTAIINYVNSYDLNSNKEVEKHFTRNKQFDNLFTTNNQRYNYHIIEEVNFEGKASDAFRVALDDYRGVDMTIITTNSVAKIDVGVRSRCEILNVPPCEPQVFLPRAEQIISDEGYNIDDSTLLMVLEAAYEVNADNRGYYKVLDEILRQV